MTAHNEKTASLVRNVLSLPRGAWLLFLGTFLNKFGTFVIPYLAVYMGHLGYSVRDAGLAIGAYGAGTLGACLLGGHLADRLGRRKTIVLSMVSSAAAMMCLSQAARLPMILTLAGLAGLTGELYRPASSALLADLVPSGLRVTAYAAYRMSFNAGWAFGPAVAGVLSAHSFLWLFVGNASSAIVYGLVAWFAFPEDHHARRVEGSLLDTWRVLRDDARLRQVMLAALLVGLVFVQAFSTMSLEITRSGFSSAIYGLVLSLNGWLVVLFELPITSLTKRHPARRMMALGFILVGIGFASNLLARTIPMMILTTALFTLGEMTSMPVSGAYVADLAPADRRGLYMGAYGMVWALAMVFGPSLGMMLFSVSRPALWATCGLFGLLASAVILARVRSTPQAAPTAGIATTLSLDPPPPG